MNCELFDQYAAEFLEGGLGPAETEALMTHVETCAACRDELQGLMRQDQELERYFARERERVEALPNPLADVAAPVAVPARHPVRRYAWAAAAMLFIALGAWTYHTWRLTVPTGHAELATLKAVRGDVLVLQGGEYRLAALSEPLLQSERIKVGANGYAALALPGAGNLLEVKGGTQIALADFPDRTEVRMNRGQVWVHLPTHPAKPLVVRTSEATATAHGTVFGVEQELDRTIVRVAEGVVEVVAGGTETSLAAGQTYNTLSDAATLPADAAVAWSQHPEDLAALMPVVTAAAQPTPAPLTLATSAAPTSPPATQPVPEIKDLAALLPVDTRFYVDLRNWPDLLAEFRKSDYTKLASEPALAQWWQSVNGQEFYKQLVEQLRLLDLLGIARMLDGQIVAGVATAPAGSSTNQPVFVMIADCQASAEQLRAAIEKMVTEANGATDNLERRAEIRADLYRTLRIAGGRLVLATDPRVLESTVELIQSGGRTGFDATAFHNKIAANAADAPLTIALDLADILSPDWWAKLSPDAQSAFDFIGVRSLDYALVAPQFKGHGMNQAARLGFKQHRAGMFDWLAEPGPMRGLDFFSPEVRFFGAAVVRNPRVVYQDLELNFGKAPASTLPGMMLQMIDQHKALLDAMGGEVAIGLENPILPVPNVKVAIEMRDPVAFQREFNALVDQVLMMVNMGAQTPVLVQRADYKGRTIYSIEAAGAPIELSWAYVDDFLVLGPGPRFVEHSIDVHDTGRSIAGDARLLNLLPQRTGSTFSLLVYQNIAAVIPDVINSRLLKGLSPDEQALAPDLSFLSRYDAPGIAYAYAGPGSIDFYLNTPGGIDLNMGMAIPVVANWISEHSTAGQLAKVQDAEQGLDKLAAAAMLYKQNTGSWPKGLTDLIGEPYLKEIPADPFAVVSGDTLRMVAAPDGSGVTFYSIGPDGTDDHAAIVYDPIQDPQGLGDIELKLPLETGQAPAAATP